MDRLQDILSNLGSPRFTQAVLPAALAGLALAAAGTAVGVRLWQRRRLKLRLRFGVFSDRQLTPYCRRCCVPLVDGRERPGLRFDRDAEGRRTVKVKALFFAFECPRCQGLSRLVDDDGYEIGFEEAKTRVAEEDAVAEETVE